jgi:hypothetical protein
VLVLAFALSGCVTVTEDQALKTVNAQLGLVGQQGAAAGGANQMNFLFERGAGGKYFKWSSGRALP